MQHYKDLKSPGLYYNHIAQLYNTERKLLTYTDLQEADQNLETVRKYAQLFMEICNKHEHTYWINLTDCRKITHYTEGRLRK
jgi:hypothetical protein